MPIIILGQDWKLSGNSILGNTSYLGTNNNVDLVFKRNQIISGRIGTNYTAFGYKALTNSNAASNAAFGNKALELLTTGYANTAIGHSSLGKLTTGNENISIGSSGFLLTTGSHNIFIGNSSNFISTGSGNVVIGSDVYFLPPNLSNNIILADGNGNIRLQADENGKVRIGDPSNLTVPGTYKLYVEDGILTEKVKVALKNSTDWADYVFEDDYNLMPLNEVEEYILQNNHLPGIQSAAEVKDSGIDLGEMQIKLLEKVEELTLHLIQKDKDIELLKKQVADLINTK